MKAREPQLVERRDRGIRDQVLDRLQIRTLPTACKTLSNPTSRQKLVPLGQSTELSDNRNVFTDIGAGVSELRVLFEELFHVLDGLNVRWGVGLGYQLAHLDVCLEVRSEVTKRGRVMRWKKESVLVDSVTSCESATLKLTPVPTASFGRTYGTRLRFTRPLCIPINSRTIAWLVHCESNGVDGVVSSVED